MSKWDDIYKILNSHEDRLFAIEKILTSPQITSSPAPAPIAPAPPAPISIPIVDEKLVEAIRLAWHRMHLFNSEDTAKWYRLQEFIMGWDAWQKSLHENT